MARIRYQHPRRKAQPVIPAAMNAENVADLEAFLRLGILPDEHIAADWVHDHADADGVARAAVLVHKEIRRRPRASREHKNLNDAVAAIAWYHVAQSPSMTRHAQQFFRPLTTSWVVRSLRGQSLEEGTWPLAKWIPTQTLAGMVERRIRIYLVSDLYMLRARLVADLGKSFRKGGR